MLLLRRFVQFQSTLPARGATAAALSSSCMMYDFNPRSLHGERLKARAQRWNRLVISIHAPRTGSDWQMEVGYPTIGNFNPRSPHGERR